ncbi:MAG: hypothetical protein ACK5HL_03055 [Bacilli bacterium]
MKDIQRLERIKDNINNFNKGYTIFLTNELSYTRNPKKVNSFYEQFSLDDNTTKEGILDWHENTSSGTKKGLENSIVLRSKYHIRWNEFSNLDDTNSGTFKILVNEIK